MDYQTVFDISDVGYRYWWLPAGGLALAAAAGILLRFGDRIAPKTPPTFRRVFSWCALVFAALWTTLAFLSTYIDYFRLRSAYDRGEYEVVEGKVEQFVPMTLEGRSKESFVVHRKRFEYSDSQVTAGFNTSSLHGGPIREGLPVRVGYVGDAIVKLETK